MDDNKIFDVTPPKTPESIAAAKNARKIMLNDPQLKQGTSATPDLDDAGTEPAKVATPHTELTIQPPAEKEEPNTAPEVAEVVEEPTEEPVKKKPEVDEPVAPEPKEPAVTAKEETEQASTIESDSEKETVSNEVADEPEEKEEPIKELTSVDSILPDDSQRAAAVAKDTMQSPTMYDTKAYYVPIGNSQHKHGHVMGAVFAGIIAALVAVGAVFAFAKFS